MPLEKYQDFVCGGSYCIFPFVCYSGEWYRVNHHVGGCCVLVLWLGEEFWLGLETTLTKYVMSCLVIQFGVYGQGVPKGMKSEYVTLDVRHDLSFLHTPQLRWYKFRTNRYCPMKSRW